MVAARIDPIFARKAEKAGQGGVTFGQIADELVAAIEPGLRNAKHRGQWRTSLGVEPYDRTKVRISMDAHEAHVAALTALRAKPVADVATEHVLAVISPLWTEAPESASRVRGRIERALDAARVKGHRTGENPARWKGHLALILPRRSAATREHHAAMSYDDVSALIARLRAGGGVSAAGLEFTILTAARTGEVLGATWGEIDLAAKVWRIPAGRMKAGREHTVPLPDRCVQILIAMAALRPAEASGADPIFPGQKRGKGLSQMALAMALRRIGSEATVHGFRSTFRDWAGDRTRFPREVAEAALAHAVGDATERAYRRGSAMEERRKLMDAWAQHCEPKLAGGNVIAMGAR